MKAWTDLSQVYTPERIARLPKDARGYPIPATATRHSTGVSFKVIDQAVAHRLFMADRCGICGEPLGRFRALVGGANSIKHGLFTDIPMHADCAEYAMKVCPFLAAPSFAYSRKNEAELDGMPLVVSKSMSTERPPIFGLGITRAFPRYIINGDEAVIKIDNWESVTWWQNGAQQSIQLGPR